MIEDENEDDICNGNTVIDALKMTVQMDFCNLEIEWA